MTTLRNLWQALGLRARIAVMLAVTLTPIGIVEELRSLQAVSQSQTAVQQEILAQTVAHFDPITRQLETMQADAASLGAMAPLLIANRERCTAALDAVLAVKSGYLSLALVAEQGQTICAAGASEAVDVADVAPGFTAVENGIALVEVLPDLAASVQIRATGLAPSGLENTLSPALAAIVAPNGGILFASPAGAPVAPETWADHLQSGAATPGRIATHDAEGGAVMASVPLLNGAFRGIAQWQQSDFGPAGTAYVPSFLATFAFWLASVIAVWIVVSRMVMRPLDGMRDAMRYFMTERALPERIAPPNKMPREFARLEADFRILAQRILEDQAELEQAVDEKNTLLGEVHHRVKNNLQLICSIINMKVRKATDIETRETLQRLQDRILAFSTIHKRLYMEDDLYQVNSAALVSEIADQVVLVGTPAGCAIDIKSDLDDLILTPEQAFSLALLTSEVMTNAVRNVDHHDPDGLGIELSLKLRNSDTVVFEVRNTVALQESLRSCTGIGMQLMEAFARQLSGTMTARTDNNRFEVTVTFPLVTDFTTLAPDQFMAAQ